MLIDREILQELYCKQKLSQRAVARRLGVSSVSYCLKKYGIATIDRDAFGWNEDVAYILGAMVGDGCAYVSNRGNKTIMLRVDLAVSDELFARRVFDAAKRAELRPHWYKPQVLTNYIKTYTRYKVGFLSKRLYELVKSSKEEPSKLLDLIQNNKQAISFLAGFYDAEGCYYKDKRHGYLLQLSNTNVPLLSTVQLILEKIGYDFRMRLVRKAAGNCKELYIVYSTRHQTIDSFLDTVKGGCLNG